MEFCELSAEEFDSFAVPHPQASFLQSRYLAASQIERGGNVRIVGVKRDNNIVAGAVITIGVGRFGYKVAECFSGPLMDFSDELLVRFFTSEAIRFLRPLGVIDLTISPNLSHRDLDIDAQPIEGGADNSPVIDLLETIGYRHHGFDLNLRTINKLFVKPLDGYQTVEELESSINYRVKKAARKAAANGVVVRQIDETELETFYEIVQKASESKHFSNRPIEYYRSIMRTAGPDHAKFMVAYLDIDAFRADAKQRIANESAKRDAIAKLIETAPTKSNRAKLKVSEELLASYEASLKEADRHDVSGEIALAGIYTFCYGPEVVSIYGGSDARYEYFNGMVAIYWHMLKYALEQGFSRFNFYGTYGYNDPASPGYPIYTFKRNFGGHVVELIGEFSIPVNTVLSKVYALLRKVVR